MPTIDRRTTAGKTAYEQALKEAVGKQLVTEQDYDEANNLKNKVISEPHIAQAIQNCIRFEHEWRADINGLPFRGFFDGEAEDYILEIKTANDANPKTIIKDFFDRKYHIQGGLYAHISGKPVKYLIIETSAPYNVMLVDADEEFINYGIQEAARLANSFKECMDNNMFHFGYDYHLEGTFKLTLPSWVK
jgi:hypothetical protein